MTELFELESDSDMVNGGYFAEGVLSSGLVCVCGSEYLSETWVFLRSAKQWTCAVTGETICRGSGCWRPCANGEKQRRRISENGMFLLFGDSPLNIHVMREEAKRRAGIVQQVRSLPCRKGNLKDSDGTY